MSTTSPTGPAGPARRRLYEVMADETLTLEAKQERALEIGRDVLDVENGHIERIRDDGSHEITVSVGASAAIAPEGEVLDRSTTYCRRTLHRDSPLALADAPAEGWADDPAYAEHGLDCYLGTTLFVDGRKYGTVCFVSRGARAEGFAGEERLFIELLARLLGRQLESARSDEALSAHAEAREASEAKYEALMNAAPAALFVADLETGETVEVNDRATELVGYPEAELIGLPQSELHPPRQRDRYAAELDRLLAVDGPVTEFADGTPLYFRRRDGSNVPVEVSASRVEIDGDQYVHGLVRDISERRARQEELRVKDRAMDEASVGITIANADADSLPLVYANRAFEQLTGYDGDDALGRNCRFLQGPATDDDAVAEIRRALERRQPVTTELVNYRDDGTPFWNELTVTPVRDGADELTHFIGIQRDVTERKRRERLVSLLNRILRHNLRNDMNVVMGYADILADQHDGETAELLERIGRTASDLSELSEKAQTIEEIVRNPQGVEERPIGPIVRRVADRLERAHPEAAVHVDVRGEPAAAVSARFSEALRELGQNAIVHGHESPSVTYRVGTARDGDVEVAVVDDGPGLPDHEQRVLESGRETPLDHGNSIGLWLVKWLVTDLGGQVRAAVDEDGTTIELTLPGPTDGERRPRPAMIGRD